MLVTITKYTDSLNIKLCLVVNLSGLLYRKTQISSFC